MRLNSIALAMTGLTLSTLFAMAQSDQTLTGAKSDAMCGKKHIMQGSSAAQFTRGCVKSGSDYTLIVGDKIYTLKGDKAAFDKFAGSNVVVKGKASGSTLTVESIKAAM